MDSLGRIVAICLFSLQFFSLRSHAQSVHGFNWAFTFTSTNIQECQNSTVQIKPLNSSTTFLGVAPYYMLAVEVEGITSYTLIGDDPSHLFWQNTHRRDAQLLLSVADSAGNTGGFPTSFFSVIRTSSRTAAPGSDTSCLASPPTPSTPRITPNVTTTLETCEPWGLSITGGTKPYNITLAQVASGVITNTTMGVEDDVFTYINRATPNEQLIAAVADATGQWGVSSIGVNTAGSSDTDCGGLPSTSKTKAEVEAQQAADAATQAAAAKAHATTVALGIVFGLVLPLLTGGLVGLWWWRRRKRPPPRGEESGQLAQTSQSNADQQESNTRPNLNLDMSQVAQVVRIDGQQNRTASWAVDSHSSISLTDSPTSIDMSSTELRQALPTPYLTSATLPRSRTMDKGPMALTPVEPMATTPNSTSPAARLSPDARYRKAMEALAEAQASRTRLKGQMVPGLGQSASAGPSLQQQFVRRSQSATVARTFPVRPLPRRAGASLRLPPVAAIAEEGPDIIIQHRDGGIVEELPPPYIDRYPGGSEEGRLSTPRRS
ncbi:hypothetical protein BD414DRAFT_157509 [Trametes punicea]|nr:hypothetical protein BD414DRAFT_157509 [Trametes punicea]